MSISVKKFAPLLTFSTKPSFWACAKRQLTFLAKTVDICLKTILFCVSMSLYIFLRRKRLESIMPKINLKTLAYNTIRSKIVTCQYAPGTFLNEEQLTTELSLSRTPVRDALGAGRSSGNPPEMRNPRSSSYLKRH